MSESSSSFPFGRPPARLLATRHGGRSAVVDDVITAVGPERLARTRVRWVTRLTQPASRPAGSGAYEGRPLAAARRLRSAVPGTGVPRRRPPAWRHGGCRG